MIIKGKLADLKTKVVGSKNGELIVNTLIINGKYDTFMVTVYGDLSDKGLLVGDYLDIMGTCKVKQAKSSMFNDIYAKASAIKVENKNNDGEDSLDEDDLAF